MSLLLGSQGLSGNIISTEGCAPQPYAMGNIAMWVAELVEFELISYHVTR
jgi:hypothetical protein